MSEFVLWHRMIELIESYKNGHVRFPKLVNGLEGIMDAQDLSDKLIVKQWYELWTPLEIRNAGNRGNVKIQEVLREVEALESFIRAQL
jgi:hypothetical protein